MKEEEVDWTCSTHKNDKGIQTFGWKISRDKTPHDLNVYGEITLKWISKKHRMRRYGLDSFGSEQGRMAGSYQHFNGPPDSIKEENFLGRWVPYLLKKS
jgi:hypothetical protein